MKYFFSVTVFGILDFIITGLILFIVGKFFFDVCFCLNYKTIDRNDPWVFMEKDKKYVIAIANRDYNYPDIEKDKIQIHFFDENNQKIKDLKISNATGKFKYSAKDQMISGIKLVNIQSGQNRKVNLRINFDEFDKPGNFYPAIKPDSTKQTILCLFAIILAGSILALIMTIYIHKRIIAKYF